MNTGLFLTLVQTVLTIATVVLTPPVVSGILRRKSRIEILARPIPSNKRNARIWRFDIAIKRRVYKSDPLLIIPESRGNKFEYFKQIKLASDRDSISINSLGHIEVDLSYQPVMHKIRFRAYMARPDSIHFYTAQGGPALLASYQFQSPILNAGYNYYSLLLFAKWRMLWILLTFVQLAIIAIARILFLGILHN